MNKKPAQATANHPEKDAFTVSEFCARNGLSRAGFYLRRKAGQGPCEMRVMSRIRISKEAAAEWRRDCEAACDNLTSLTAHLHSLTAHLP